MTTKKFIVSGKSVGVYFGEIKNRKGSEVTMTNVRNLWYWEGACSLMQLALEGTKKPDKCTFTVIVPEITLLGINQIIPCSEEAVKSIEAVEVWKI